MGIWSNNCNCTVSKHRTPPRPHTNTQTTAEFFKHKLNHKSFLSNLSVQLFDQQLQRSPILTDFFSTILSQSNKSNVGVVASNLIPAQLAFNFLPITLFWLQPRLPKYHKQNWTFNSDYNLLSGYALWIDMWRHLSWCIAKYEERLVPKLWISSHFFEWILFLFMFEKFTLN